MTSKKHQGKSQCVINDEERSSRYQGDNQQWRHLLPVEETESKVNVTMLRDKDKHRVLHVGAQKLSKLDQELDGRS